MANASGQDCVIQLQTGTYTLTIANTNGQENAAAQGDLDITDSGHTVTIQGQGPGVSIVNGNGIDRVFQVLGGANAGFRKLTIEGGVAQDDGTAGALSGTTESEGGGVLVQDHGHVTLSQVLIIGNQAIGGNGAGGVCPRAANGAPGGAAAGGGLFLSTGMVDLTDSKMSVNTAIGGNGGSGGFCRSGFGFSGVGGDGGAGAGGGLYIVSGNASLSKSTVSGNNATGASGGPGVCFPCSIEYNPGGNGGDGKGAGLFIGAGALSLRQTTVSGNSARGGTGGSRTRISVGFTNNASGGSSLGAGIFVASGNIGLANSTLFANTARRGSGAYTFNLLFAGQGGDASGGGLYLSRGSVSLIGGTVASNQALTGFELRRPGSSSGGGIANPGATGLVSNTTLIGENEQDSGSTANGDDVSGPITSSHSLFGQTAGASISDNGGNIFNMDPGLSPDGLRGNGGPTQTVALEIGSPAIDAGDNAVCAAPGPTGLGGIDQRGVARFRHGDSRCDIGAYEFVNLAVLPTFLFFGSEPVGGASPDQIVSETNNQLTSVTLRETIEGADAADFAVDLSGSTCSSTLAPHSNCLLAISFSPRAAGKRGALLTVSDSSDRTSPYQVPLIGVGK